MSETDGERLIREHNQFPLIPMECWYCGDTGRVYEVDGELLCCCCSTEKEVRAEMETEIAAKDKRIAELEAALQPFAAFARRNDDESNSASSELPDSAPIAEGLTLGDCRKARAALHAQTIESAAMEKLRSIVGSRAAPSGDEGGDDCPHFIIVEGEFCRCGLSSQKYTISLERAPYFCRLHGGRDCARQMTDRIAELEEALTDLIGLIIGMETLYTSGWQNITAYTEGIEKAFAALHADGSQAAPSGGEGGDAP